MRSRGQRRHRTPTLPVAQPYSLHPHLRPGLVSMLSYAISDAISDAILGKRLEAAKRRNKLTYSNQEKQLDNRCARITSAKLAEKLGMLRRAADQQAQVYTAGQLPVSDRFPRQFSSRFIVNLSPEHATEASPATVPSSGSGAPLKVMVHSVRAETSLVNPHVHNITARSHRGQRILCGAPELCSLCRLHYRLQPGTSNRFR